jgi:hypothetical protein
MSDRPFDPPSGSVVRLVRSARFVDNGDTRAAVIHPLADDDQTLRALGRRARAQREACARAWEAVTRGERGEDEVAVERLAAGDAPEDVAAARAIFRPPSEAEHAALVEGLLVRAVASRVVAGSAAPVEPAANDAGRRWWAIALSVAAAVALAWWLAPGDPASPPPGDAPVVAHASIPAYAPLETDGGLTALRSEPAEPAAVLRYRADTALEWRVRPQVAAEGPIGARLFAFGPGSARELATADLVEVSGAGAVRVIGRFGALGLSPGSWTIAIVVGRPAALPSDPALVRDAPDTDAWIVRRLSVLVED